MWRDMGFRRPVAGCFNGPKKRRHPPPGHPCPRQPFSGLVPGSALASGNRRCQRGWRSRLHQVHDLELEHGAQRDQFSTVMCRGLIFSILYIAESSSSLPNSGAPGLAWTQRQRPPADWRAGLTPPHMCVGTLRRTVVRCGCDAISEDGLLRVTLPPGAHGLLPPLKTGQLVRMSACQTVTTKNPNRSNDNSQDDPKGHVGSGQFGLLSVTDTPSIVIRATNSQMRQVSRANE